MQPGDPLPSPVDTLSTSRRDFTLTALSLLGGAAFLSACGDSSDSATCCDEDTSAGSTDTAAADNSNVTWATGGTASMSGDYADPFTTVTETSCSMVCAMTLGPCYAETKERQDITEGYPGLPTRLALRILDTNCEPVAGVYVDVWHAAIPGLYSGSDASDMCTESDADMLANRYFRGVQKTNAEGRVDFDTCFPGWYSSRALHVHFQVRTGTSQGSGEYVTAQLFFAQSLIEDVYSTHPEYTYRGQPDVLNTADKVLGDNDPAPYTLETAKQADGALLAWKTIVIRASLSETLCTAPEASGGGGP